MERPSTPHPLVLRDSVPPACAGALPLGSDTPTLLSLEAPRAWTSEVLGGLAPMLLRGEAHLYCVDGGNSFDPYVFSSFARRAGRRERDLLRRVHVTRAFTIHQLEEAAREMIEPLVRLSPRPAVAVLGLDHLFLEETLPLRERRRVLLSTLASLCRTRDGGVPIVATHDPPMEGRGWWRPIVEREADARGRVSRESEGEARIRLGGSRARGRGSPFLGTEA